MTKTTTKLRLITSYRDWTGRVQGILAEYKKDNKIDNEPLDGDETENLTKVIGLQIDYNEGNITRKELVKGIRNIEKGK